MRDEDVWGKEEEEIEQVGEIEKEEKAVKKCLLKLSHYVF